MNPDGHQRGFAARGQTLQNFGVGREFRPAIDPHGFRRARQQENQANMGVLNDIGQPEDQLVAGPVRDEQRVGILNTDKPRPVPFGRDILISLGVCGGEQEKRRALDEVHARLVQLGPELMRNELAR